MRIWHALFASLIGGFYDNSNGVFNYTDSPVGIRGVAKEADAGLSQDCIAAVFHGGPDDRVERLGGRRLAMRAIAG